MHIVVCTKLVPNPEAPFSMFKVDEHARRVAPAAGMQWVMSPFDEQAMEAALRIRDHHPGTRITCLTLGSDATRNALKHGLAMGADDGVLLSDQVFAEADAYLTAIAIAAGIRKLGSCNLVLAGRQAADWDAGIVGAGLAEILGQPVLSFAKDVQVEGSMVRVERVLDDGTEIVETALPAVVTVSNELGAARVPSLRETMRAARKPVECWTAADLQSPAGTGGATEARIFRECVFVPEKISQCEIVGGSSPQEQAEHLLDRLREARVL